MAIERNDDGTLDTVLRCSECGEEFRGNYEPGVYCHHERHDEPCKQPCVACDADCAEDNYQAWVAEFIAETEAAHACPSEEPTEPEEGDITTEDHRTFYQDGRLVLEMGAHNQWWYRKATSASTQLSYLGRFASCEAALRAYMERTQYFPNAWFISDHGNAHLMDLSEGEQVDHV